MSSDRTDDINEGFRLIDTSNQNNSIKDWTKGNGKTHEYYITHKNKERRLLNHRHKNKYIYFFVNLQFLFRNMSF